MRGEVARFLFEPQSWVVKSHGNPAIARYHQERAYPLSLYKESDFESFGAKLLLLDNAQWEILGLTVAVSPFIGNISNNLNGNLRRAVKQFLSEEKVHALDQLASDDLPAFLLPPSCWRESSTVAGSGIAAVLECAQLSPNLAATCDLRWEKSPPAVANLTLSFVEVLCQISLPTVPWLSASKSSE